MHTINLTSLETGEAWVILAHGLGAIFFAFVPIFAVVLRELKMLKDRKSGEHAVGKTALSLFFIAAIALAMSAALYQVIIVILEYTTPKYAPISGENGITHLFWQIQLQIESLSIHYTTESQKWTLWAIHLIDIIASTTKKFIMSFVPLIITYLSFRVTSELIEQVMSGGNQNIYVAIVISVFTLAMTKQILIYYSYAMSWIINHPFTKSHDPYVDADSKFQSLLFLGQQWWLQALFM